MQLAKVLFSEFQVLKRWCSPSVYTFVDYGVQTNPILNPGTLFNYGLPGLFRLFSEGSIMVKSDIL